MAFERLEPFGALHQELMAGAICATSRNNHGGIEGRAAKPSDFMHALASSIPEAKPVLHADPEKQSQALADLLMRAAPPQRP